MAVNEEGGTIEHEDWVYEWGYTMDPQSPKVASILVARLQEQWGDAVLLSARRVNNWIEVSAETDGLESTVVLRIEAWRAACLPDPHIRSIAGRVREFMDQRRLQGGYLTPDRLVYGYHAAYTRWERARNFLLRMLRRPVPPGRWVPGLKEMASRYPIDRGESPIITARRSLAGEQGHEDPTSDERMM